METGRSLDMLQKVSTLSSRQKISGLRLSLQELLNDIDSGLVEMLVIVGGNRFQHACRSQTRSNRMFKTKLAGSFSVIQDETSELCHWQIPGIALPGSVERIRVLTTAISDDRTAAD